MQRARAGVFPRLPVSLEHLTRILEDPAWKSLTNTLDLLDNIYAGSKTATDGSHHIVFMSARGNDLMRNVDTLFLDGTFFISLQSLDVTKYVYFILL